MAWVQVDGESRRLRLSSVVTAKNSRMGVIQSLFWLRFKGFHRSCSSSQSPEGPYTQRTSGWSTYYNSTVVAIGPDLTGVAEM